MADVAVAFRDADGPMRAALIRCLDFMNDLPAFRAYKKSTWDALAVAPGKRILDVACGVGFDVAGMATGWPDAEIVGVDKSLSFLDLARARMADLANAAFVEGEADRLPFPDATFDGARIDRSLQHIPDPAAAVAEMVRVTRPGGRIVASEPDWGTFFLYNGDRETSDRMAAKWRDSFAHPFIGRELGAPFARCGVVEMGCRAHALAFSRLDEADVVFDLKRLQANCVAAGVLPEEAAAAWRNAAEAASRDGTFLACLTIIERWGTIREKS